MSLIFPAIGAVLIVAVLFAMARGSGSRLSPHSSGGYAGGTYGDTSGGDSCGSDGGGGCD